MRQVNVAGLNICAENKTEVLILLSERLKAGQVTKIFTPYSEFLYAALGSQDVMDMLNLAEMNLPDGVGILWADTFLSYGLIEKWRWLNYILIPLQALWVCVLTLTYKQALTKHIPHRISGSTFIYDLAKLCADQGYAMYLLGGFGDTPDLVKQKLLAQYPTLKVVGASNKNPADTDEILADIKKTVPAILLVSFGPLRQEQWIAQNIGNMPSVKVAIGLGGTLDYIAGKKLEVPEFFRKHGLEWLFRFFTQPSRFERIIFGTFGLMYRLIIYKFRSMAETSKVV